MRRLPIPQNYEPGWHAENPELRVFAVEPAGSDEAALQLLIRNDPECSDGLTMLRWTQPELADVLCQLIGELDGLAYLHPRHGLLPLAREPLWHNLPVLPSNADHDVSPNSLLVAEWLARLSEDADYWWGGLTVETNTGFWRVSSFRPVRERLANAAHCHIARQPHAASTLWLILDRLPYSAAEVLRLPLRGFALASI